MRTFLVAALIVLVAIVSQSMAGPAGNRPGVGNGKGRGQENGGGVGLGQVQGNGQQNDKRAGQGQGNGQQNRRGAGQQGNRRRSSSSSEDDICARVSDSGVITLEDPSPCTVDVQQCSIRVEREDGERVSFCEDTCRPVETICAEVINGVETDRETCPIGEECGTRRETIREAGEVKQVKFCRPKKCFAMGEDTLNPGVCASDAECGTKVLGGATYCKRQFPAGCEEPEKKECRKNGQLVDPNPCASNEECKGRPMRIRDVSDNSVNLVTFCRLIKESSEEESSEEEEPSDEDEEEEEEEEQEEEEEEEEDGTDADADTTGVQP